MLYPVMLLVGIGIGTGIGMLISKPKIDEQKKEIDLLVKQMQTAKAESEETIQRAAATIARNERELKRAQSLLAQTMAEMTKVNEQLKSMETRSPENVADTTEPVVVITTQNNTPEATGPSASYTVKDGDSLWKIAQEQLGDGNRYKEILKLNPGLSEDQTLKVGMSIKIPAQ